jgi:hypothetical protein
MKMKFEALSVLFLGMVCANTALGQAGQWYSNVGPGSYGNGPSVGFEIDGASGYSVTDSFIMTGTTNNVYGFSFVEEVISGDTPSSVSWAITTAAFGGTVEASGASVSLTGPYLSTNAGYGVDIFQESVSFPLLPLGPGTYWLQLDNATTAQSGPAYWDESDGPSAAQQNISGVYYLSTWDPANLMTGSETFIIQVPEGGAASLYLLLGGASCLVAMFFRSRSRSAA